MTTFYHTIPSSVSYTHLDVYKRQVIRVALTGRTNTPDMYEIMKVLGKESIEKRLKMAMK